MKNLLTYIPEPFENLEIMDAEYEVLADAGEMEDEFGRAGRVRRPRSRRGMSRRRMQSLKARPVRPLRPRVRLRRPVPIPFVPLRSRVLVTGHESSEHVRWVQDCLNRILDLRLIVDGIMNRETRSALREFQRRNGLAVTGFMGPDTEEVLKAACQQAAAEPEMLEGEWDMQLLGENEQESPYCFYNPAGDCVTLWGNNPNDASSAWRLRNWQNPKWAAWRMKYCRAGHCNCNTIYEPTAKCPAITGEFDLTEVDWEAEATRNSPQKVRWIQASLNKIFGLRLKIDGIMGTQTRSAIRSFQKKNGLIADGVVGQRTVKALLAALSASGALLPASSAAIATTNLPVLGSSDFRARAIKVLEPLPPYPQEITSNGPQRNLFTQMTGLTQEILRDAWAKGKNLTSCNAFTGWFSRAMGSKKYLGRFDLNKAASRSWVPASSGRTPKYGDILRFKTFHVGIALDLVDGILHTAEGGQGGPKRGFDAIKRKQIPWDPSKFMGWVDLEDWIRNGG